jgi:hypothetical protein
VASGVLPTLEKHGFAEGNPSCGFTEFCSQIQSTDEVNILEFSRFGAFNIPTVRLVGIFGTFFLLSIMLVVSRWVIFGEGFEMAGGRSAQSKKMPYVR